MVLPEFQEMFDASPVCEYQIDHTKESVYIATCKLLRCMLHLLRYDLQLIVAGGELTPPSVFVCPVKVRAKGTCVLVTEICNAFRTYVVENVGRDSGHHANVIKHQILGEMDSLWMSKKLSRMFPVRIESGNEPPNDYVLFAQAIINNSHWEHMREYAAARVVLLDEVLLILDRIEGSLV